MLNRSFILCRAWLTPGPHKGWDPSAFPHFGKAFQMARVAKHLTHAKLSFATGIKIKKLSAIEKGFVAPLAEEVASLEQYTGVHLIRKNKSRIQKAI